jgi:hypothetical protein
MTDVELSSLLSDFRTASNQFNSETAGVNAIIESVQTQLVGMNLGLECWVSASTDDVRGIELGFAKITTEWCLAFRSNSGNVQGNWLTLRAISASRR